MTDPMEMYSMLQFRSPDVELDLETTLLWLVVTFPDQVSVATNAGDAARKCV